LKTAEMHAVHHYEMYNTMQLLF